FIALAAASIAFGVVCESTSTFMLGAMSLLFGSTLLGIGWMLVRRDAGDVIAAIASAAMVALSLGEPRLGEVALIVFALGHAAVHGLPGLRIASIVMATAVVLGLIIGVTPHTSLAVRVLLF